MYYYQIYGCKVASDYKLEGAYELGIADDIDITIQSTKMDAKYLELTEREKSGEIGHIRHFSESWAMLRIVGTGVFIMDSGNKLEYYLFEGAEYHYVCQLFLCYFLPTLLIQRGMLLIHGSCVYYKGKSLIISGDSGAGKSSLTNEIMSHGYRQMSDDIVAIAQNEKGMLAYPSFPVRKLCADFVEKHNMDKAELIPMPDVEREKYGLILKDEYYNHEAPLGVMVIIKICDVDEPVLEEITGSSKLKYLTENFFRQDVYEQVQLKPEEMIRAIKVAGAMPIYVIKRPRDKMTVKQQADLIEKNIVI